MSRIEIRLPDKFNFFTEVPIRIGDVNRGQHVSHVALITIIEEARARFWSICGYGEQERDEKEIGFIIADLAINYIKQITYGPPLKVEIGVNDFSRKGYDIVYRVSDILDIEVARAKTGIVVFDYRKQQAISLPDELRKSLTQTYLR
jgi:acyl-CoA thioester hydrolase